MTLNDLKAELENDSRINLTILQSEAADIPKIYGKWVRYISDLKCLRLELDVRHKKAVADAYRHFTGKGDDICMEVFATSELKHIVPAHDPVTEAYRKLEKCDLMLETCYAAIDTIKQKGFAIKHIIEQRKFEHGA